MKPEDASSKKGSAGNSARRTTLCGGRKQDNERSGRAPPGRALAGGHRGGAGETPREREECVRQRREQGLLRSPAPGAASAPVNERREGGCVRRLRDFSRLPGTSRLTRWKREREAQRQNPLSASPGGSPASHPRDVRSSPAPPFPWRMVVRAVCAGTGQVYKNYWKAKGLTGSQLLSQPPTATLVLLLSNLPQQKT